MRRSGNVRWNYPGREALAYERGLLEDLPPGLSAPRCFGHTEHGSQHQLWLEDLGSDAIRWRLDDYGKAARSLGRFNGAYLTERSLPVAGWLSRQWLRSWLAEGAAAVCELPRFRRHPLVQRVYQRPAFAVTTRRTVHPWLPEGFVQDIKEAAWAAGCQPTPGPAPSPIR
jgi:hypothetical protein